MNELKKTQVCFQFYVRPLRSGSCKLFEHLTNLRFNFISIEYNRPIAGTVNFCPLSLNDIGKDWGSSVSTVTHELMHGNNGTKLKITPFCGSFFAVEEKLLPDLTCPLSFLVLVTVVYLFSPRNNMESTRLNLYFLLQ